MACFSPLDAWRADSGDILFRDNGSGRHLQLPCGQCVGCRLERSRQWAVRCMHEASLHKFNVFATLTYDDSKKLVTSLCYSDFQKFIRATRKRLGPFRYYMCGEYGERYFRPHYHALLFGLAFADRYPWRTSSAGFDLFRSPSLESLWPHGFAEIGEVTFDSAAYVARYVMKKVTGPNAEEHYKRVDGMTGEIIDVVPEFTRMSLKPGIGHDFFLKYRTDIYKPDGDSGVVVNGMRCKPPRYYDQLAERYVDDMNTLCETESRRETDALSRRDDNTPDRLRVRESVARSRLSFRGRSLE